MNDTMLRAALAYAERYNWHVFPLVPRGKRPVIPKEEGGNGYLDATTDPETIRQWWARRPNANIGVACGASGLVVVDLDGQTGIDTWADLDIDDDTVVGLTGGGGQHLVFSANGVDIRNSASMLGAGVDIRADGGYIVVPPSVHPSSKLYAWEVSAHPEDVDPAPLPAPLLALLAKPVERRAETEVAPPGGRPGDDFNARGKIWPLLEAAGWTMGSKKEDGTIHLTRPGKADRRSTSATWNHGGRRRFHVFSTNAEPFKGNTEYSPFAVYAFLRHNGVYGTAARALAGEGYGEAAMPKAPPPYPEEAALSRSVQGDGAGAWRLFTGADALLERDPTCYVIEGMLALPSLNILYGAPGSLKSLLLLDAALCVAGGKPWLAPLREDECLPFPVVSVPVLWLDFDTGLTKTHERVAAGFRAYGLDPAETPFYYVSMPSPWLDASDASSIESLIELANAQCAGLIVIDNLGTVKGAVEENSSAMIQVMSQLRQLAERTGAAVSLIHHQRKATGFGSRKGESLRGHTSIEAALDLALLIERDEHEPTVTVQSTKTRGVDVAPFGGRFTYDHASESTDLFEARFFGIAVEDDRRFPRAKRAIFDAVAEPDLKPGKANLVNRARELSNLGKNYLGGVITQLVGDGKLQETTGDKNQKIYR